MVSFKVDENLPMEAGVLLRAGGHDDLSVREQGMIGSTDNTLADVCQPESRAIVTLDLDFADFAPIRRKTIPG